MIIPTKLIRKTPTAPIHIAPKAGKGEPTVLPPFVMVDEKVKNIEKNNNPSNNNAIIGPITKIKLDAKPSFLPDSNDISANAI